MSTQHTREQVAEALGICPTTIYRWEKRGISPVVPKRLKRSRQLRYSQEDIEKLRTWMNEVEEPAQTGSGASASA